jgi:hypothetical protein
VLDGWRRRAAAGVVAVAVVAVAVVALAVMSVAPPARRYLALSADGRPAGCFRVYHSAVDVGRVVRGEPVGEPLAIIYGPGVQPVITSFGLAVQRDVVEVLADHTVFASFVVPGGSPPWFYRQPTRPVRMVVVYPGSGGPYLAGSLVTVGGVCAAAPVGAPGSGERALQEFQGVVNVANGRHGVVWAVTMTERRVRPRLWNRSGFWFAVVAVNIVFAAVLGDRGDWIGATAATGAAAISPGLAGAVTTLGLAGMAGAARDVPAAPVLIQVWGYAGAAGCCSGRPGLPR